MGTGAGKGNEELNLARRVAPDELNDKRLDLQFILRNIRVHEFLRRVICLARHRCGVGRWHRHGYQRCILTVDCWNAGVRSRVRQVGLRIALAA